MHQFYGDIIDEFRRNGYEVHVVTSSGPEIALLRERDVVLHIVDMERRISIRSDLRSLRQWLQIMRTVRPDVVLGGTPKASLLSMVSALVCGVPKRAYFLQGLRLEGAAGFQRFVLGSMEKLTSWCSNVVVAVSPSLAKEYVSLGLNAGRQIKVPHHGSSHGVDASHFRPAVADEALLSALHVVPTLPVVTFVGRLTADKGPSTLLAALQLLMDRGVGFQVLILGAQDEADSSFYLSQFTAAKYPVLAVNHIADVRPYLSATTLLVLPTLREGMPNVVLEAAAMGIPAITTTATGAIDSIVDGQTGLAVPVNDASALAAAMERLLADPALRARLGAAARARVVELFQPSDVAHAIVSIALQGQHAERRMMST